MSPEKDLGLFGQCQSCGSNLTLHKLDNDEYLVICLGDETHSYSIPHEPDTDANFSKIDPNGPCPTCGQIPAHQHIFIKILSGAVLAFFVFAILAVLTHFLLKGLF